MSYSPVHILALLVSSALAACGGVSGVITAAQFTSWSAVPPNSSVEVDGMSQSATATFTVAPNAEVTVTSLSPFSGVDTAASSATLTFGASRQLRAVSISTPAGNVSWDATVLGGATISCTNGVCRASSVSANSRAVVINPYVLGWNYQTFGVWETGTDVSGHLGALSVGAPTRVGALPVALVATYNGTAAGWYVDPTGQLFTTAATMAAMVDFTARSVTFSTTNTTLTTIGGAVTANAGLDLSGTLTYASGSARFAGPLSSADNQLAGTGTGRFYGPAAEEIGGIYSLSGGGRHSLVGGFGGKR